MGGMNTRARKPVTAGQGLPPALQEAVTAHRAGRLDEAHGLYRRFVDEHPAHPTALQLFGLLQSQRGEFAEAVRLMEASLGAFPQQPEVANNLGNALSALGRHREAVDSYGQALRLYPRYAVAFRNLGLSYLELGILDDAGVCFRRCLDIDADDAAAWLGLGSVQRRRGEIEAAVASFSRALAIRPDYAEAHHNLGACLRLQGRSAEAVQHYEAARGLGLDRGELYQNLAGALVDAGEIDAAMAAYRIAIDRNPRDPVSHHDLNKLMWEQDRLDGHLDSYRDALTQFPDDVVLRRDLAMAHDRKGEHEEAERVLMQGLRLVPDSVQLKSQLACTLEEQGRWTDALLLHHATVRLPGVLPHHRVRYARALLACRRPEEALPHAEQAVRDAPLDQAAIAYLALCWRLLGDERDGILNDYEAFVRVYDVPAPARFADVATFNLRLGTVLDALHTGRRHPPEQTLRGGTQTRGNLFDRQDAEIRELTGALGACVGDYITRLPWHESHPLLSRRAPEFAFNASWSVRLQSGGHHRMHVHPLGWLSSAYYVQVPPEIVSADILGGGIVLGQPDIDVGPAGAARRRIQPAVGKLVLFPSYMWHGTVPFTAGAARLSVAFDVVPVGTGP